MAKSKKSASRTSKAKSSASKAVAEVKTTAAAAAKDGTAAAQSTTSPLPKTTKVGETKTDTLPTAAKKDAAVTSTDDSAKVEAPKETKTPAAAEPAKDSKAGAPKKDAKDAAPKSTAKPPAASTTPPPPPAAEPKRRGGFVPLVLGGVIAGGIGYGVSEYDLLGTRGQTVDFEGQIAALTDQIAKQTETMTAQETRLAALESAEPVAPDLSAVTDQITGVGDGLAQVEQRLAAIESQELTGGGTVGDAAAYERELKALQASLEAQRAAVEEQRAEIEGLIDNARSVEEATADAARTAALQAALTKVTTAIGAGQPFADQLADMQANGLAEVPAALSDVAADGVTTLNNLQTRFADNARAALSAARASAETEPEAGLGGFLKRQLGARSVAPKEGSDPDAILSRVEAAVRDGQLDQALSEIDGLPQDAQAAMQDWLADARARQAAEAAVQDLSNSLTAK